MGPDLGEEGQSVLEGHKGAHAGLLLEGAGHTSQVGSGCHVTCSDSVVWTEEGLAREQRVAKSRHKA
jgi:hypothetical protein